MLVRLCFLVLLIFPLQGQSSAVALLYHHVDDKTPFITSISPESFDAHLQYLNKNEFIVLPLDEIVTSLQSGKELPKKTIAITFDDAYINIYTTAFPMLKKLGYPFTIFVATNLVDTSGHYLTWEQLKEMSEHGALIANHTRSHTHLLRRLPNEEHNEWIQRVTDEIEGAQQQLEDHLGKVPKYFAYPYGEYNGEILELVKNLGYIGLGQQSGAIGVGSDFLSLPRYPMAGAYTGMAPFKTKVNTIPLPVHHPDIDPLITDGDLRPTLELNFTEGKYRTSELTCYGPGGKLGIEKISNEKFMVHPVADVPVGRSRYNCTMPSYAGGRYHWFSQPWIRKEDDGSWYPEP
jgi:poly-beta-1,6-N-acetyl-D-glucosamine N-deacetylase